MEDYKSHFDDEVNEDGADLADSIHTLELDLEPSESGESQSDSESVLGDFVDMYGDTEASAEHYEF